MQLTNDYFKYTQYVDTILSVSFFLDLSSDLGSSPGDSSLARDKGGKELE